MASQDKLIPSAIALSNNLHGIKTSTTGTFKLQGKPKSKWANPFIDVVMFFASIYAKQNKIATGDMSWNHKLDNNTFSTDLFTVDQNTAQLTLGSVVAISEAEWDELQVTISKAYNIIKWLPVATNLPYNQTELANLYSLVGIGYTDSSAIYGADGKLLGTGFSKAAPDYTWHKKWNDLKVPYDKALDIETPYIAPIAPSGPTPSMDFFRYTGNRRWFFNQSWIETGL